MIPDEETKARNNRTVRIPKTLLKMSFPKKKMSSTRQKNETKISPKYNTQT